MNTTQRARALRRDGLSRDGIAAVLGANPAELAAVAANPNAPAPKSDAPLVQSVSIDAESIRASAALGLMSPADQVTGLEVARGLIEVVYSALWRRTVQAAELYAQFFLNDQPVKMVDGAGGPVVDAKLNVSWNDPASVNYLVLHTSIGNTGLWSSATPPDAHELDDDVPMVAGVSSAGGSIMLRVPPGTHKLDVRFAASAGEVRAKQRRLWAWGI
jgi:hypothetical protein